MSDRRNFIKGTAITAGALAVSAQETETRSLANFSELSVGEAISVVLIPGTKNEAVIKVRNIDLEDVETNVSGGRLKIELSGSLSGNQGRCFGAVRLDLSGE